MADKLDQLPDIYNIVRSHIEKVGSFYGYSVGDFDAVHTSFRDEPTKEDFLQELYDALPTEG